MDVEVEAIIITKRSINQSRVPAGKAIYYPGRYAQGFPGGDGNAPGNGGGGGAGGAGQNALPSADGSYGGIGVKAPWCPSTYGQPGSITWTMVCWWWRWWSNPGRPIGRGGETWWYFMQAVAMAHLKVVAQMQRMESLAVAAEVVVDVMVTPQEEVGWNRYY